MDFILPSVAFIEGLGGPEMVLILVIVLVLFGGEKLPDFARGLGKSIREFKKAAAGVEEEFKRALEEDEHKKSALPPPPATFPAYPPVTNHIEAPVVSPGEIPATIAIEPAPSIVPALTAPTEAGPEAPAAVVTPTETPVTPDTPPPVVVLPKTEPPKPGLTEHLP